MSDGVTGLGGVFFRADTDYFGPSGWEPAEGM